MLRSRNQEPEILERSESEVGVGNFTSDSSTLVLTKGIRKVEVLGLKPPLELDILQNLYYLRKGN